MPERQFHSSAYWVAAALLVLPLLLVASSVRSLHQLQAATEAYLRSRVATLASLLESIDATTVDEQAWSLLAEEEPALVDLTIYSPATALADPLAQQIASGQALFFAARRKTKEGELFRAYIPYHTSKGLHVARFDLAAEAGDFLLVHARHHVWLSLLASLALIVFTAYYLWNERRAARMERRQLELEHLAQIGQMASVLAHEIRNPLGTIKGFVQLASEQVPEPAQALLAPVLQETDRLERLVRDLLTFARPQPPRLQHVEWAALASQLETHARHWVGDRKIHLEIRGDLGTLETDPDLLLQVLLNVLKNAIEAVAGNDDGWVVVEAAREASRYRIRILDNGPGIPREIRDRIFFPFVTTKASGSGLGLAISRKLVTALGGSLNLQDRPGGGTIVEIVLAG